MTPEEARLVRVNDTLIGNDSNPDNFDHVRSGFRVQAVLPNGLQLRRLNACYLRENVPIESWVSRWDQLKGLTPLPLGCQIPLL